LTAFAVINVAAWSGLRLSELRGLCWFDFDGTSLHIHRTRWRTHLSPPKTEDSETSVPCIPLLIKILFEYRAQLKKDNEDRDHIFAGEKGGNSLNLNNLYRRVILPKIEGKCEWKAWHAFRRGLATNLAALNVQPVAAILRRSDIKTTLSFYQVSSDEESRRALSKIEEWCKRFSICASQCMPVHVSCS
jgi:integrase